MDFMNPELQRNFIATGMVIIGLWLIRFIIMRIVRSRTEDVRIRYNWQKGSSYLAVVLGVVLIGRMWLEGLESLVTYLGLVTAGLTVALQEPIVNVAGWLFILSRRPFVVGDRVQVGDHAGDVADVGFFQFALLEIGNWAGVEESTGRIIYIPNGQIFSQPLANYGAGFAYIWHEIKVNISFDSNWKKAQHLLQQIVAVYAPKAQAAAEEQIKESAQQFLIDQADLKPRVFVQVTMIGVSLTLRYLCEPPNRRETEHDIWTAILTAFNDHNDIEFAFDPADLLLGTQKLES